MSDLYTALRVSPRKKRVYSSDEDDTVMTPKKLRVRSRVPTPPATPRKPKPSTALPDHLARFQSLQSALHHAMSHALATAANSPSDTGIVPNVLTNHTLSSTVGLSRTCTLDDLKRLCWLWEWDGEKLPKNRKDDDNPFLESSSSSTDQSKNWMRGGAGLVITPTTYLPKGGKRVPAYGIGIEVEINMDKNMPEGMAAVARWTASGDQRMKSLSKKLHQWVQLHADFAQVPLVPMADLPPLVLQAPKQSALTQRLVSLSPKSPKALASSSSPPVCPPSPTRSKTPAKSLLSPLKGGNKTPAIPFPLTPVSLSRQKSSKGSFAVPQTPATNRIARMTVEFPCTPKSAASSSRPSTPVHQMGTDASTAPETPSSSRRAALYERIRKRSESQVPATPSKIRITTSTRMTKDQLMRLSQEEMRRRCLLGRLGGVAESIWMYFSSPTNTTSLSATPRKRRTLPTDEVVQAILKSSPVPISAAEALESIELLISLCPFFLKQINVGGEDWLEMPSEASTTSVDAPSTPTRGRRVNDELKTLSPKRVKREQGGLREVRERIKRELDAAEE